TLTTTITSQFDEPYGIPFPIGTFGLVMARHMHEFGTTEAQFAEIAVAARKWAQLNPKAWIRDALTIEDVLASRPIADPIKKLDCCLITDGGGVVILTSRERARDAAKRPVRVIGAGEHHTHWHIGQLSDLTVSAGRVSGREA